jgi:hypothetical protein
VYYCSSKCQRKHWPLHIFDCNPTKPINTAHHLARAVIQDRFPDDLQTCEDYGFERAFCVENQSNLLGLFKGLILNMGLEPQTIHRWRLKGILVGEIKRAFETLASESRGRYYPWFLKNQWVLDWNMPLPIEDPHRTMLRGWQYAGGSSTATKEEINVAKAKWPEDKHECLFFCVNILGDWQARPEHDIWLHFGFCTCKDGDSAEALTRLYRRLLFRCSFDQLCTAYKSSTLVTLFDSKGLTSERLSFRHLEEVLLTSPDLKSVWPLKRYVVANSGRITMPQPVAVDYGFSNCEGETEMQQLKEVYVQFFAHGDANPIELHEAAVAGSLFEYVRRFIRLPKKFRRLMKNPYPQEDM